MMVVCEKMASFKRSGSVLGLVCGGGRVLEKGELIGSFQWFWRSW